MISNIMKISFTIPALGALVLQFFACNGQDPINLDPNPVYASCCGAEPVEFTDAAVYLFVPNVFTPNGDGVNDLFQPVIDYEQVEYVTQYTIYQDTIIEPGEGYYNSGVFFPKTEAKWWDGTLPDGTKHTGPFEYDLEFYMKDGSYLRASGRACLVRCGPDAVEFLTRQGCFFGTQTADGKLNKDAAHKEDDCFK
jgi:hypothetical protein